MQRKQWGVILRAKEYWIQPEIERVPFTGLPTNTASIVPNC